MSGCLLLLVSWMFSSFFGSTCLGSQKIVISLMARFDEVERMTPYCGEVSDPPSSVLLPRLNFSGLLDRRLTVPWWLSDG